MKVCNTCEKTKEYSEFPKRKSSKDGYRNQCKSCCREYKKRWVGGEIKKKTYKDGDGKKQCRKCMSVCDISNFGRSKQNKDGLKSYCNSCKRDESVRYRVNNPDKVKQYREDNKERIAAYKKEYRKENREIIATKDKERYKRDKNKIAARQKRWYNNGGKEKVLEGKRKRRSIAANVEENYTKQDARITMESFGCKCFRCGCTENLHVDHHRPLSKGHALSLENAVVLCETCNKSKHDKDPEDFYGTEICAKLDRKLEKIASEYKEK